MFTQLISVQPALAFHRCTVVPTRTYTGSISRYILISGTYFLWLLGWPFLPVMAQSAWQVSADSAAQFAAKGDYASAYPIGIRAALISKPLPQADSLWAAAEILATHLPDSILVKTPFKAGTYYFMQNEYERSGKYLTEAVRRSDSLNLPLYQLQTRIMLAKIEARKQNFDRVKSIYKWILKDTVTNSCLTCQLEAMIGLAGVYAASSPDSAKKLNRTALEMLQQLPNYKKNVFYPMLKMQLARFAQMVGDQTTAMQEIEESYSIAKEVMPSNPIMVTIAYMYAYILGDVNDKKALDATQTAQNLLKQQPNYNSHPFYLWLLHNEIGLLRTLGRTAESVLVADSVFQRHSMNELLQLPGADALLLQVSRTYIDAERDVDLEKIVQKANELLSVPGQERINSSFLYSILGRYYQYKRNYAEAVRCLKEEARLDSVNITTTLFNYSLVNRLATCQAEAGQRADAYASFQRLVADFDANIHTNLWLMSDAERNNYLQTTVISGLFWYLLHRINPQPHEIDLAYNYKLLNQGVRLKTNRTINRFMHAQNRADSSLTTIRQLMGIRSMLADRGLSGNSSERQSLQQTADSLERTMGNESIVLNRATSPARWQDIRNKLKPGEAAVELVRYNNFLRGEQVVDSIAYSAFLIRPEWSVPKVIELPALKNETKGYTRNEIKTIRSAEYYMNIVFSSANKKLVFSRFWQPITTALGSANRLYMALDGDYQGLNPYTIQNPRTGRYLADDVEIVLVNSTLDILEEPRVSESRTAELVGYPAYSLAPSMPKKTSSRARRSRAIKLRNGLTFEELPHTKTEVQQLGNLFRTFKLRPQERLDTAASESAFQRMRSPRILHVATHGYLQDSSSEATSDQLLTCGLVLAGAADTVLVKNRTDGILTGYEASLLNLHDTELVTLSACETGLGDYSEGEGLSGLQRAFLLAGARSVLVSLWKVNDQLTQQLMTDFYRYWLSGMTKPQALRKAQANLRKQYPNPYYWGAFVLIGQ